MRSGGANFETHVLHEEKNGNLRFSPTIQLSLFTVLFSAVPFGFIIYAIYQYLKTGSIALIIENIVFSFVIIIFFGVAFKMLYDYFKPNVFNIKRNVFQKGYKTTPSRLKGNTVKFSDIVAIQILGETVINKEENTSFNSFELNLVLINKRRIHIIDHNNLEGILDDAERISQLLNIPIWHKKSSEDSISINFD